MATMTVQFRGICCFIDRTNGESFAKRVVLPGGNGHNHAGAFEHHLSIIEYFADDLDTTYPLDPELKRVRFTRAGDGGKYEYIEIPEPSVIELLGVAKLPEGFKESFNLDDLIVHLDDLSGKKDLKETLLGPAAEVDSALVNGVIDLPDGMLTPGPPEPFVTEFDPEKVVKPFRQRVARWLEHIVKLDGQFAVKLTALDKPKKEPVIIRFKPQTRLISIANEPIRLIVGQFVERPQEAGNGHPTHNGDTHSIEAKPPATETATQPAGTQPERHPHPVTPLADERAIGQPTGHFDMYWNLIANPPRSRPAPIPFQGTSPGCAPSNKP